MSLQKLHSQSRQASDTLHQNTRVRTPNHPLLQQGWPQWRLWINPGGASCGRYAIQGFAFQQSWIPSTAAELPTWTTLPHIPYDWLHNTLVTAVQKYTGSANP